MLEISAEDILAAETLGARIAQARRVLGVREWTDVTQKVLADRVGVADATVSRWENNEIVPREPTLKALAQALGLPREALGERKPKPPQSAEDVPQEREYPPVTRTQVHAGKGTKRKRAS